MMPTLHCLRYPFGVDPLPTLRAALRDAGANGVGFVASPRLRSEFWHGTGLTGFCGTLDEFATQLMQTHDPAVWPLAEGDLPSIVAEVARLSHEKGELPHFGPSISTRSFPDQIAATLREAQETQAAATPWPRSTPAFRDTGRLLARYQDLRSTLGGWDRPAMLRRASAMLRVPLWPASGAPRTVVLHGYFRFTEPEWEFLTALIHHCETVILALPESATDQRDELFASVRRLESRIRELTRPSGLFESAPTLVETRLPGSASPLGQALFHPGWIEPRTNTNVMILEAPGSLGEARMVARRVRELRLAGVLAERILITTRDWRTIQEPFQEALADHGIRASAPSTRTLADAPAIRFLLRAWRLPDQQFPFAPLAATLRSTWFRPAWKLLQADPELPLLTETLLRAVGEPRGHHFEQAVRNWSEAPPAPLEDETGDIPRRERLHRLAQRCLPFVQQFFALWKTLPERGTAKTIVDRFLRFGERLGIPDQDQDWQALRSSLDRVFTLELPLGKSRRSWSRADFTQRLEEWLRYQPIDTPDIVAWNDRQPNSVRMVRVEEARGLSCDYLFVVGLSEGSFPQLAPPASLWTDADRGRWIRESSLMPHPTERLGDEMRLFVELVSQPRHQLILSYPAVDSSGQALLPSSFLTAVRELAPTARVESRRMPIEGYGQGIAASQAEWRWQYAGSVSDAPDEPPIPGTMLTEMQQTVWDARRMLRHRINPRCFSAYDGFLNTAAIQAELARRFDPKRVLSPTALESYVACPFQFLLTHVLRLEPLADPSEEIELSTRGAAIHRALARYHQAEAAHVQGKELPASLEAALQERIREVVQESMDRAAGPAARMLWELEGKRLLRGVPRYQKQWQGFRTRWDDGALLPQPTYLEANFGLAAAPGEVASLALTLRHDGTEVRIGGRIDRVDVAYRNGKPVFWILDYKTGSGRNYPPADATNLKKLQLALYALAVERVLLEGKEARPAGFAYWITGENGPKYVTPVSSRKVDAWLRDPELWPNFRSTLEAWVVQIVQAIRRGEFPLAPRTDPCPTGCPHAPVCRIGTARSIAKPLAMPLPIVTE